MNKLHRNGFTLVEIIAVIAVMAIIMLVAFPSVLNVIQKKSDREYDEFLNQLCQASEYYILNISTTLENQINTNGQVTIRLSELNNNELIKRTMVNPKTDTQIDLNSNVTVKKASDGTYQCSL